LGFVDWLGNFRMHQLCAAITCAKQKAAAAMARDKPTMTHLDKPLPFAIASIRFDPASGVKSAV